MTQADIIHISNQAAMKAGFRLADFEPPSVTAPMNGKWTVFYEGKTPVLGNHFLVWVDDRTGKTKVMLGE